MKTLTQGELKALAGDYFAPVGLYEYTKTLPFLGSLKCNASSFQAGQWTEFVVEYTVGASGLADGAWIKGTFKFYSDWALFQTSEPKADNYVSTEYIAGELLPGQTPATVQALGVRFDQKGHERPFQKAVIIDVVDGYMNPGDKIIVRMGDRRWGARGTRVQTFVEKDFRMRWYIDPAGTSRFAAIKPDISLDIVSGPIAKLKLVSPRVVRPGVLFPVHVHAEDEWGNVTVGQVSLHITVTIAKQERLEEPIFKTTSEIDNSGWTFTSTEVSVPTDGHFSISAVLLTTATASHQEIARTEELISVDSNLPVPRVLFADLHVHSDDTVGTNSTAYNFSYARHIAGLDIVGYTANDFQITAQRWQAALETIKHVNSPGRFVVFPGTEWCGNSAAGGDHNVVFLDDPAVNPPEFPLDRHGNVARSFEWNEDGPSELAAGAWPLDEVYATYAHAAEANLLIPHVGGRRCNLAWHHPELERLLEIGSAWGHFEWLLRDAVQRGWKMGVCANSDEHRGRCGGGVPGTAVFGTKGGLTGVLAERLERADVAWALRARRTFATTGERLVGLASADGGRLQGDDVLIEARKSVSIKYRFWGSCGFASVEAWNAAGCVLERNLQAEAETGTPNASTSNKKILVRWGGARLYDRYREAVWEGSITITGGRFKSILPFGGVVSVPEERIMQVSSSQVTFKTRTSGDFDGVALFFEDDGGLPSSINIRGRIGGYVKVGDPLKGNPHKPQPEFQLQATKAELSQPGGALVSIAGGVELSVQAEIVADLKLPTHVVGNVIAEGKEAGATEAIYFVGREWNGAKVITSPVFVE